MTFGITAGEGEANTVKRGVSPSPNGGLPAIGAMRWPGAGRNELCPRPFIGLCG